MSRRNPRGGRSQIRTDRIASTLRDVIADELARIGDDTVEYVTVTEVVVDNELTRARVYLSTLDLDDAEIAGVQEHAPRIRKAVARRARLRRVPELVFMIDPGLRSGERVDTILRSMVDDRAFAGGDTEAPGDLGEEE